VTNACDNPLNNDRAWALFYRDNKSLDEIATALNCPVEEIRGIRSILDQFTDLFAKMENLSARERLVAMQTIEKLSGELDIERTLNANLAEALDQMTGRKKAEAEARRRKERRGVKLRRNRNYLQSVQLGLVKGLWFAPTTFWHSIKEPLMGIAGGILMLIANLLAWCITVTVVPVAGLLGCVSSKEKV